MTLKEASQLARQRLTYARYTHTEGVAQTASALAARYGVSPDKAEMAGWLHDIVKQAPKAELLQLMSQDVIMAGLTKQRPFPIWHGPCGAIYAKYHCDIHDEDILSAISCHTTGKPDMSTLDKILFLADVISPERNFASLEALRALSYENLDAAVISAMQQNLAHLQKTGKRLDENTLAALASMQAQPPADTLD